MADKSQIKIRFITRDEDESLHVEDKPLYVPISLKRYGLSEIVNHLLETESPVPFDFLINGTLLRTSIEEYLTTQGLSSEAFLTVEYTRAVLPPSYLASFNNEDWVSSLDIGYGRILSGSYDGIVRTWDMSGKVQKQYAGHSGAIKAVAWVSETRVVSAGNDRQVRLWKAHAVDDVSLDQADDDEPEAGKTLAILEGHKAPISALAVNDNRILSAGYDNAIGFWSTNYKEMVSIDPLEDSQNKVTSTAAKKRRKLALQDASVRRRAPLAFMEGHSQPVEAVMFDAHDNTVAYSASQDHTIKTWDLVTSRAVDTRTTGFSLLSMVQLPKLNLIACGSSARHITLHDPRADAATITQSQLVGHTNFVVSLAASPDSEYMFASGSHDGTVKVWDVRAQKALYTITRESGEKKSKVFAVKWGQEGIVTGGEDKKIQINTGVQSQSA
ncbi:Ribosome biogenesis protein YTM1 [Cyberlindnera fabianii]|uniref:Ribosome biogenesis protein YTM1 n=1 Tax=Cyberlindnera fabianii TaxID=36022 RepID=A0A1V2L3D7_CYBFA|nr:Ribosome biogenesis protein YTM1 [Cyberlindnera fabianii]